MKAIFSNSRTSIRRTGQPIAGALDRQARIAGFDQSAYSAASVLCIGAGGLISHVAPALCRKGIGRLTVIDPDIVEASNLNRQQFFRKDIGQPKALALVDNLQRHCTTATILVGYAVSFQQAAEAGIDLSYGVVVCGVDNNPTRVAVSRHFRAAGIPVVFLAVSADADHGYVFVQEPEDACLGCLFPDVAGDDRYPCPGTPAIADILQTVGGIGVYAIDSLVMDRPRFWDYRRISLADDIFDRARLVIQRDSCRLCRPDR